MRSVLLDTRRQYEKRDRLIEEPIGSVLRWTKNHNTPYAKIIVCTFSVLRKMRSVLPNTSRQYEKPDRLIEEPIGSVL